MDIKPVTKLIDDVGLDRVLSELADVMLSKSRDLFNVPKQAREAYRYHRVGMALDATAMYCHARKLWSK